MKINESSNRNNGEFLFHRKLLAAFGLKQERAASLKGQYRNTRRDASLKCLRTKARDIKPQVMVFPGHFDGDSATSRFGHLAAPSKTSIGALEGLDRERGSFFDHDHLAHLEARHFLREPKSKFNILALRR